MKKRGEGMIVYRLRPAAIRRHAIPPGGSREKRINAARDGRKNPSPGPNEANGKRNQRTSGNPRSAGFRRKRRGTQRRRPILRDMRTGSAFAAALRPGEEGGAGRKRGGIVRR